MTIVEELKELAQGGYLMGPPKSDAGRRVVSLRAFVIDQLTVDLAQQAETAADRICGADLHRVLEVPIVKVSHISAVWTEG